jgi:hypothetical protein
MTQDEILSAAKEAGCNDEFIKLAPCWLEAFAKSIERKTIEQCASTAEQTICECCYSVDGVEAANECAAAIRKLGEE